MTQQTGTHDSPSGNAPSEDSANPRSTTERPAAGGHVPRQNSSAPPESAANGTPPPPLGQLRSYLTALIDVIDGHPEPSMERDETQWRLRELVDELTSDEPSARRVRSRWLRLIPPLTEVRPDVPVSRLSALLDAALPPR